MSGERPEGGYVLVVDDDDGMRETVVEILTEARIEAYGAGTGHAALRAAAARIPSVAVIDHRLPDMTGIDVVHRLKNLDADLPVIVVTGYATLETAISAVGIVDEYLTKPVRPERVVASVRANMERRRLARDNRELLGRLRHANARLQATLAARLEELDGLAQVAAMIARGGAPLSEALDAGCASAAARGGAAYLRHGDSYVLAAQSGRWSAPPELAVPAAELGEEILGSPPCWSTIAHAATAARPLLLVLAEPARGGARLARTLASLLACTAPVEPTVPVPGMPLDPAGAAADAAV